MLTPASARAVCGGLRARIACAVLALGGALLSTPGFAQAPATPSAPATPPAPPIVLNSVQEARAATQSASARITELDARYSADEKNCMKTFFANACANRAREVHMKEKADLQLIKQHAELYLRVDADNIRRARVAENLSKAEEDQARRQSAPQAEPKVPKTPKVPTPPARASAVPSAPVGEPGSSPLTDLGPMPSLPVDSSRPAPIVKPLREQKPDDSAKRADNRDTFERKSENARRYAEDQGPRAAKASADRERRRAAREAETKRLEGRALPAGPATVAPVAPTQ